MNDELKNGDSMDDLDAQLASLGIFGGDDEDSVESSPEVTLDNLDSMLDELDSDTTTDGLDDLDSMLDGLDSMLDDLDSSTLDVLDGGGSFDDLDSMLNGLNGFDAPKQKTMTLDDLDNMDNSADITDDLDAQLDMMLKADKSAEENFEIKEINIAPKQSVFDSDIDGMGTVQYVKGAFKKEDDSKNKLFDGISGGKILATFVAGLTPFILVGGVTAFLAINAVQKQQVHIDALAQFSYERPAISFISNIESPERSPIEIPRGIANNANFIHINERLYLGETPFTLSRISAAFSGTFIYFDEFFNPDDYNIFMYNQARNLYARTTFDIIGQEGKGTVLKFAPLSGNTMFLTLHIQCKNTNEFIQFNYRFRTPPIHDVPVFINQSAALEGENNIIVNHAVFDSASSKIHFSFMPDSRGAGYRLSPESEGAMVALRDGGSLIRPFTTEDALASFDEFGVTIGAATFESIRDLEENVEVIFNDLEYFYPNPKIDARPEELFNRKENNIPPIPVKTGPFTLNFEGMKQEGTLVILTVHGLDENGNRRAVNMDITLRVVLPNGTLLHMPGTVRSSSAGADIIFDMAPHALHLRDIHISRYTFVVDFVEYTVPTASVPIRVSQFYNMQSMRLVAPELTVTEAFLGLLAYKSRETKRDGIIGISQLNSEELFEIFAPVDTNERPMYSATVSAGSLISNYDYVAVAEVLWVAGEGADLQYFKETFEVTARSTDSVWNITDVRRR